MSSQPSPWREEFVALVSLAFPLAMVQAGNQLMGLIDAAIVGRLGAAELGAVGVGNAMHYTFALGGLGVMMGLDPLIAQSLGAGDTRRAKTLAVQGFWLALGVGSALTVVTLLASLGVPHAHLAPAVARATMAYLPARAFGIVPLLWVVCARSYLQATNTTRVLVTVTIVGNALNAALAVLWVFGGSAPYTAWIPGLRGVQAMGVQGASWAYTAATAMQFAMLLPTLVRGLGEVPRGERGPRREDLWRALTLGAPIGLQLTAEVAVFALVGLMAARIDADASAAHQVALTLSSVSFTFCLGIASAGSVRVGRAVGALDAAATRRAGMTALGVSMLVMSVSAVVFTTFPVWLVGVITDRASVAALAVPLLAITAVFQLGDGLQVVGAGVLRGAGDTRAPFLANLVGHYTLGLPLALALSFGLHLGLRGLWWGLCAGLWSVAAVLTARFAWISSRPITPIESHRTHERGG